jgi:hypothetical protein
MALIAAFVPIFGPDPAIIEPTEVGPGAAVRYHEVQSGEKHAIVIRSTGVPKIELSEVSSDDPRVKALQGSRVGDTVRIPGTYADTQVRIDEVRADVVFRYQDSMHSFQERFPGVAFIQRFSAVDKDGNPNVAEIRRVFEEHARARATVLGRARGWYRSKGAPVGAVAQVLGATVVEAVAELVGPGDRVFCVPPGPGDYKRELSLFAACDAVLLDATALSTLILLDLQELFDAVPKQLVIARGTLSELEAISQQRGKPADIVAWIERIRAKCEVVGGGALLQLTSSERTSLVAVVGAACAEGVAIARDRKLPLWCDDFNTWRGVTTFASFRVWTQLVAQACQGAGTLATEKLTDVSVRVFAAGYRETVVDHLVIVRAAELAGWNPNVQPYASLLGWLRDVSAPTVGIGLVVGRALVRMADTAPLVSQEPEDAVEALVDAVGRRRDGGVLVETLSESLGKLLTAEHGGQAHVRRTLQATVSRMKK